MFERRLRWLLGTFALGLVVFVLRLAQLQMVHGAYYSKRAEESLLRQPEKLPAIRGRILDRTGRVLVRDEPTWNVAIEYDVLAADVGQDESALRRALKRWAPHLDRASTGVDRGQLFHDRMTHMWQRMARLTFANSRSVNVDELRRRARRICTRVARIHDAVTKRRGFDTRVKEETQPHALWMGLDEHDQITAREALAEFPWVHVQPSSARQPIGDGLPFAHVLGRMGRVDANAITNDARADDRFMRYLADDRLGVSGVEWLAEARLRGRRGEIARDRRGHITAAIDAQDGADVVLTIHADLQRRVFELLGEVVEAVRESSGGAVVVLDVATREVLALVSYPSYDPRRLSDQFEMLANDTQRMPLRFRAVSGGYAPGSTIKPLVCLAGLMNGQISLDTRMTCTGYLFPDQRNRWRCWQIHGSSRRKAHGSIDVVEALVGSCNVFMYSLGEGLGVDRLCGVFDMVGIGRSSGIGLREESVGVNPTPGWLNANKNTATFPGHARLFAMGQGELTMTPLQVANVMATYASGRFRPVRLLRHTEPTPEWELPVSAEQLRAVQRGIYGVVNDPHGTAFRDAHLEDARYALCGKTGSATAHSWPTSYRITFDGGDGAAMVAEIYAGSKSSAIQRFVSDHPAATFDAGQVKVATRWPPYPPPAGERFSHAWFGGYLQELGDDGLPAWEREPKVAFAALIEFGGSGGRVAGPLAKRIARLLLEVFGDDLNLDRISDGDRNYEGDCAS